MMNEETYEIGIVGLGVMGRNLLLNMADHGYAVAGYDKDPNRVKALQSEGEDRRIQGASTVEEFVSLLRSPRAVMMLVPAGPVVDSVIRELLPYLHAGDLIIDGGNSYFKDTDLRGKTLAEKSMLYLGVGTSGGEHGARYGPSLMPGGPREAYERVRSVFEAIAAKVGNEPCVAYLGPRSAGHYAKMVHNGIEYGLMRLIAETYDLMKRGLGLNDDELHDVYDQWNHTELNSFLLEITERIFCQPDDHTRSRLVDVILDEAKQMGTGRWASQDAMDLGVPVPTIDVAVAMRNLSAYKVERGEASLTLKRPVRVFQGDRTQFLNHLRNALYVGMILTYAQGMAQLLRASETYGYHLNLEEVARIWRGGCIIRAALLEKIRAAYRRLPQVPSILLTTELTDEVMSRQEDLRSIIAAAVEMGISVSAFAVSLGYLDAYRSAWVPANLVQAQRDYFGAHTYERVDAKGIFHTHWEEE